MVKILNYESPVRNHSARAVLDIPSEIEKSADFRYSLSPLHHYNAVRHLSREEARNIAVSEGLDPERINSAIENKEISTYFNKKGSEFLDRLDIGRLYSTDGNKRTEDRRGLTIEKYFTKDEQGDPLENTRYGHANMIIKDFKTQKTIFEMQDVEIPEGWEEGDLAIVAQKYFIKPKEESWKEKLKDKIGRDHEYSPKHLIRRVTNFVTDIGAELAKLQITRKFAFNSPVQFNAGVFNEYGIEGSSGINFVRDPKTGKVTKIDDGCYVRPQTHACFIKGPSDSLESILEHVKDEGAVFSAGSGIGQNIGILREEGANLSGGGQSSGPMSFFKILDTAAGSIKSGGKSRRAARMTVMDGDHPDIMKFVRDKIDADHKALDLMKAGWSPGMDGEAATSVDYQNTNLSARQRRAFFESVRNGGKIQLRSVKDGRVIEELDARKVLQEISYGSWRIGDPAIQYTDMIDEMHTCKNSGRIMATNPCSEYVFLDDTSCNLASTNLVEFTDEKGNLDVEAFVRANRLIAIASDIWNDAASYPIADIAQISPEFRTIGVGYAGLGNLLMRKGISYGSDKGRSLAGALTALMNGTVYEASAEMAEKLEPFTHFRINKKSMLEVMNKHRKNLEGIVWDNVGDETLKLAATKSWDNVVKKGEEFGFRNAQATVLAPTGTISYLMGCSDSTGVEPSLSLMIYKNLAGGGNIVVANREIGNALTNLGYPKEKISDIIEHVSKRNTVIGAPHILPEHVKIFDTAFGNSKGDGSIAFEDHIKMLGATQPFISGAISKTCNLPESASVRQIFDGYLMGNDLNLKALAIFRNNSKPTAAVAHEERGFVELARGQKEELKTRRNAFESEVEIISENGKSTPLHVVVSEYPDGRPGQIVFLSYKAGSTLGALLTTSGIQASAALKRGVHLNDIIKGWSGQEFKPSGRIVGHPYIKMALSPLDYASKLLSLEYLGDSEVAENKEVIKVDDLRGAQTGAFRAYDRMEIDDWDFNQVINDPELGGFVEQVDDGSLRSMARKRGNNGNGEHKNARGKTCDKCGNIMLQTAPNCFKCDTCGEKIGGCGL